MAISFCKVASNLDSHPKIRKAGRLGREVFLFALRRNAESNNHTPGYIDRDELDPEYLADQLMMPVTDAVTGVTAAVTAGLLREEGEKWAIVAWKDGWGKSNGTGADRTRRWRENKRMAGCDTPCDVTPVTGDVDNVTRDGCDTDQIRLDQISSSQVDLDLTELLISRIAANHPTSKTARLSDAERNKKRNSWSRDVRLMRERDGHSESEIRSVIEWCQSDAFWKGNILSTAKLREKWDQLVAKMGQRAPGKPQRTLSVDDDVPPLFTLGGPK